MLRKILSFLCFPILNIASTSPPTDSSSEVGGCGFNDDILLEQNSNDYSGFQDSLSFKWDDHNNEIPYVLQDTLKQNDIEVIEGAMDLISKETDGCIRFKPVQENEAPDHHVVISAIYTLADNGLFTSGSVGPNGKKVTMTMTNEGPEGSAMLQHVVLHELGHVLGLAHTQKRYDSDEHITVNYACIQTRPENRTHNFTPLKKNQLKTFGIPYMCNSMMHYKAVLWQTHDGCDTISAKTPKCAEEGIGGGTEGGMPIKEDWDLIKKAHCMT